MAFPPFKEEVAADSGREIDLSYLPPLSQEQRM